MNSIARRLATLALVILLPGAPVQAQSQDGAGESVTTLPERLTKPEMREIVSRLSDDDVRALLISQLDKVAVEEASPSGESADLSALQQAREQGRAQLAVVLGARDRLGTLPGMIWRWATDDGQVGAGRLMLALALALIVGYFAEGWARRKVSGLIVPSEGPTSNWVRMGLLVLRGLLDVAAVAVAYILASGAAIALLGGGDGAGELVTALLGVVAAIWALAAVSRVVLAPQAETLRLLPISSEAASAIHRRVIAFGAIWWLSGLPKDFTIAAGGDGALVGLVALIMSAVLIVALMLLVLQVRGRVADYIRESDVPGEEPGRLRQAFARNWHWGVLAYLAALWLIAVVTKLATGREISGTALVSLLILVAVPLADNGLRTLCERWFRTQADPEDDSTRASHPDAYELAMLRNFRIVMVLAFMLLFARIWRIDVTTLAAAVVGGRLAGALFEVVITLVLAYAVWSVVNAFVERAVGGDDEEGDGEEAEMGGAGATRVETLLPLLRVLVQITLIVMVAMLVLSALGVNIGPLLAGAGVLGLAVGFGAQTLVKDVISGFFFLLDDAFRMGEYVDVGSAKGTVEKISVRSMQLRHHNGPVNTVPFGEIGSLKNFSRDWAIMKFEFRLPFGTDVNKVRKIIKKVGQEMEADPVLGPSMLAPLKSQGINRMDDSALILRAKFTAKPGEQFILRREAYTRMQAALSEGGIEFAPRRVIVETADGKSQGPAAAGAAAGALDAPDAAPT